jgi:hypothetical protein
MFLQHIILLIMPAKGFEKTSLQAKYLYDLEITLYGLNLTTTSQGKEQLAR